MHCASGVILPIDLEIKRTLWARRRIQVEAVKQNPKGDGKQGLYPLIKRMLRRRMILIAKHLESMDKHHSSCYCCGYLWVETCLNPDGVARPVWRKLYWGFKCSLGKFSRDLWPYKVEWSKWGSHQVEVIPFLSMR